MQTDKNNNRYEIYQTGYLIGCLGPIPWVDLGDGASPKHIHPNPLGSGKRSNIHLLNMVMLHIK